MLIYMYLRLIGLVFNLTGGLHCLREGAGLIETLWDMCMRGRVGMKQRNKGRGGWGRKGWREGNIQTKNKQSGGSSEMGAHSRSLEHAKVPILGYSVQSVSLRGNENIFMESGVSDVPVHSKLCSRPRLGVTAPAAHSCKQ